MDRRRIPCLRADRQQHLVGPGGLRVAACTQHRGNGLAPATEARPGAARRGTPPSIRCPGAIQPALRALGSRRRSIGSGLPTPGGSRGLGCRTAARLLPGRMRRARWHGRVVGVAHQSVYAASPVGAHLLCWVEPHHHRSYISGMPKWLSFGKRTVSHGSATASIRYNLADYPPGTSLPPLETPDFSGLTPRMRRRAEKKWPKLAALTQAQLEH